jgi:RNA polymerase sigma factor (sigma-70 family)
MATLLPTARRTRASGAGKSTGLLEEGPRVLADEREREAERDREEGRAQLETALMVRFRDRGTEADFEALYEVALEFVRRSVCAALRGSTAWVDPSELVQDVFVNIYRYAGGFRDEHARSFRSWASTICANVVRRHFGRRAGPSLQDFPGEWQEPADTRDGPVGLALCGEERRELTGAWQLLLLYYAAAWRELSPRDRLALHLVEVEGLSYAEACQRLKVGMSNMKMIMFRARKRIRARIGLAMEESPVVARRLAG